jgi:DNA polymerase I-like protein with 3'-5' exonuclease and polymerase domains
MRLHDSCKSSRKRLRPEVSRVRTFASHLIANGSTLSRKGSVELVALCFEAPVGNSSEVFLVDIGTHAVNRAERVRALKRLIECAGVQKVIHDSRMDCDALYHLHGISLTNVHDTSCFHAVETGREDVSLNDVLSHNGVAQNVERDKSVYKTNPSFRATRPLTTRMIDWSASDVDKLLRVETRQESNLVRGSAQYQRAIVKSNEYTSSARNMKLEHHISCHVPVGRFTGPRGNNLRSLQERTHTMVYQDRADSTWMVYYNDPASLATVRSALGN